MSKHSYTNAIEEDDTVMVDSSKYPFNLLNNTLYQAEVRVDPRDEKTPDNWVKRHPDMVRLTGIHPYNSEVPISKLVNAGFFTPTSVHYTRNHGAVPKLSWADHRLEIVADSEEMALGFHQQTLTMDDIVAMPSIAVPATLCCAGNRRKEGELLFPY
jgi:nitrate reductase (NAD(P)H)